MGRTLLIVPDDERGPLHWIDLAIREGATEIVSGIPPVLAGQVDPEELPVVYVEQEPEPLPEPEPQPEVEDPIVALRADLDWLINFVVTGEA